MYIQDKLNENDLWEIINENGKSYLVMKEDSYTLEREYSSHFTGIYRNSIRGHWGIDFITGTLLKNGTVKTVHQVRPKKRRYEILLMLGMGNDVWYLLDLIKFDLDYFRNAHRPKTELILMESTGRKMSYAKELRA